MPAKETISETELSMKLKTFVQDVIERAIQQYIKEAETNGQLPVQQTDDFAGMDNGDENKNNTIISNDHNEEEMTNEDNRNTLDTNNSSEKNSPNHEFKPLLNETKPHESTADDTHIRERCLQILEYIACCRCTCFRRTYNIENEDNE